MRASSKLSIKNGVIDLSHGAGGRAMTQLIQQVFMKAFNNDYLNQTNDNALLPAANKRLVMATDSFVVTPRFFAGGNIGDLAVNGTINDIAVGGGEAKYLSASFIIEEGFALNELKDIVSSMAIAAQKAGVLIVTGDTKVVEKGAADGLFINTTAIGEVSDECQLPQKPAVGDKIILSDDIGRHGITILSTREGLSFCSDLQSDTRALNQLIAHCLEVAPQIRCMRDPTRGGVAAVMNEWAQQYQLSFLLNEASIPLTQSVQSACELLGLDPLHLANEGCVLIICPQNQADLLLEVMKNHEFAKNAAIIGEVIETKQPGVVLQTAIGGTRLVDWISGEQLPRIC